MPKVAHDFSKEMIFYIIKCIDLEKTEIYVGSTFSFVRRKYEHKSNSTNPKSRGYHFKQYVYIRENGGWDAFTMTMLDRKVCIDMLEARKHEQTLITQYKANLNMRRAFVGKTIPEYIKEYYTENANKIKEYKHQYYIENSEKLKEKITCECGIICCRDGMTRHFKSKQHQAYLATKESVEIA